MDLHSVIDLDPDEASEAGDVLVRRGAPKRPRDASPLELSRPQSHGKVGGGRRVVRPAHGGHLAGDNDGV